MVSFLARRLICCLKYAPDNALQQSHQLTTPSWTGKWMIHCAECYKTPSLSL